MPRSFSAPFRHFSDQRFPLAVVLTSQDFFSTFDFGGIVIVILGLLIFVLFQVYNYAFSLKDESLEGER